MFPVSAKRVDESGSRVEGIETEGINESRRDRQQTFQQAEGARDFPFAGLLWFQVDHGMHTSSQDADRHDSVIPLDLIGRLEVSFATAWAPAGEAREEFVAIQSRNEPSFESTFLQGFVAFETLDPRGQTLPEQIQIEHAEDPPDRVGTGQSGTDQFCPDVGCTQFVLDRVETATAEYK